MKHSEIRKHYFLDKYVIISPKRSFALRKNSKKIEQPAENCYFCPPLIDQQEKSREVVQGEDGKWLVKVIENKFPALSVENLKAFGKQEIVVETPKHGVELHELSLEHLISIIDIYIDRFHALKKIDGVRYVSIFKNSGGKAGASIAHSHSQIIAMPVIPPKIEAESLGMTHYLTLAGNCPYCDIIKSERGGPRVIAEDEHFFVLAPFASESPFGAWFIPKRHFCCIDQMQENEKESLARLLRPVLKKLTDADIAYNFYFQNSLENENHHMVLKLAPRPNVWGGLELATGIIINPMPPEDAAKFYREP